MPAFRFAPCRFALLALAVVLAGGCAALGDLRRARERPASLEPVAVKAVPQRAYETALTLAFDRGYQILYSDDDDYLIELEALDQRFIFSDRARRIDLFVRSGHEGETRIHARVHSFATDDPGDIEVRDEDRQVARKLLRQLVAELDGRTATEDDRSPP
jgi:hypothetical protein